MSVALIYLSIALIQLIHVDHSYTAQCGTHTQHSVALIHGSQSTNTAQNSTHSIQHKTISAQHGTNMTQI